MKDRYVQASKALLLKGKDFDSVLKGLKQSLKRHGHERLLKSVLTDLEKEMNLAKKSVQTTVTIAKSELADKEMIEKTISEYDLSADYTILEDPTLIGGFTLSDQNKRVDTSYKSQLLKLYRAFT